MFRSGRTSLVKDLNQQHVLNLVRMHPGIAASEIHRATKLQMSTISYTLRELKTQGLIQHIGYGDSTVQGGKPPVLWDLSPAYGYVIGIELMPKEMRLVLLDFSTKIRFQNIYSLNLLGQANRMEEEVRRIIKQVLTGQRISPDKVLGVGLGIPGLIDARKGIIRYSHTFGLKDVPFGEMVQRHFSFPVAIGNDANAGALGIKWLSRTEHLVPNILYVTINQNFRGMGTGLIINHELYEGAHGFAGEITAFLLPAQRQRIVAQAQEKYGKNAGIIKRLAAQEPGNIPVVEVVEEATQGDEAAKHILRQIAKVIGMKLSQLVDILDPHIVVIGGDICGAEKFIAKIIRERVHHTGITEFNRKLTVQFSAFGIYSVAMGSTALILQRIFRQQ